MAVQLKHNVEVLDLELISHARAYAIQKETIEAVLKDGTHRLIFCEHPAVLTLGRLGTEKNILYSTEELNKRKVEVLRIDRGGEVTLHSPGQLVIYPIFHLKDFGQDLKIYLRKLEEVAIDLLQDFDIVARRILGQTGIWVDQRKIVSIGIGVKKWVSYHGMAVNVNNDLSLFSLVKPCGLDVQMTSVSYEKESLIPMEEVKSRAVIHFSRVFQFEKGPL